MRWRPSPGRRAAKSDCKIPRPWPRISMMRGNIRKPFKDYLVDSVFGRRQGKGPIHSTIGDKYLYETRYQSSRDPTEKLTAQLISLVICQHHGLCDCLSVDGEDKYTQKMETDKELFYGEAMGHYTAIYRSEEELERLFQAAYGEVEALCQKMQDRGLDGYFTIAMVQRFLLSAIIDGDYSSTYHFICQTRLLRRRWIPKASGDRAWSG